MAFITVGPESITASINEEFSAIGGLLPDWCAINSGSLHQAGLERMRLKLARHFGQLPARMEVISLEAFRDLDGQSHELGQALRFTCRPEATQQIFLCGHYDTVFESDHPFQIGRWVDDNTFNGPGAIDMKGGLLTLLLGLRAFEKLPGHETLGWEILIVPDEEIGSPGSTRLIREAAHRHQLAMVFEPAMGQGNCVRRRMGVGTFHAEVTGRAAHTGRDFKHGRNAIAALARFLLKVEALNNEIPGAIFNTGTIQGGGPVNIVPDRATGCFNVRINQVDSIPLINARFAELVDAANREDGIKVVWKGGFNRPPKEINPATEKIFALYQNCARQMGVALDWADSGGGSDGSTLAAAGVITLDGVGPRGGNLHSDQEFILVDSIAERAAITANFLLSVASGALQKTLSPGEV